MCPVPSFKSFLPPCKGRGPRVGLSGLPVKAAERTQALGARPCHQATGSSQPALGQASGNCRVTVGLANRLLDNLS